MSEKSLTDALEEITLLTAELTTVKAELEDYKIKYDAGVKEVDDGKKEISRLQTIITNHISLGEKAKIADEPKDFNTLYKETISKMKG